MHAFFSCKRIRKRHQLHKFFVFAAFSIICGLFIYNLQIMPVLLPLAEATTVSTVTLTLQNAVGEASTSFINKNLVQLNYGADGTVVSLETDTAAIASISASLTRSLGNTLGAGKRLHVQIPLGNLSGTAMLMGRGPMLSVPISISPQIICNVENEFYESGINQTLHRIVARIEANAYILLPMHLREKPSIYL